MSEPGQLPRDLLVRIFYHNVVQGLPYSDLLPSICNVVDAANNIVDAHQIVVKNRRELVSHLAELVPTTHQHKSVDFFDYAMGNGSLPANFISPNARPLRSPAKDNRTAVGVCREASIEELPCVAPIHVRPVTLRCNSSHSRPSHLRPSKMGFSASGILRSISVSSIRRMNRSPVARATSQLNSAVLAVPMCIIPVGDGAMRVV
jgi:hypothetical protein